MSVPDHDPDATRKQLGFACLMTAVGGLLLGVQLDATGRFIGTGHTTLGIGALVSLVAVLVTSVRTARHMGSAWLPRDAIAALGLTTSFFGFACVVGAVLAPGGSWMFFEMTLLIVFLLLRRRADPTGPALTPGLVGVLALMLLFRLWITYQGSQHRWAVMEIDVPILSGIPLAFLDPVRSVSLGAFTPNELGFPPAGLNFSVTTTIWALGFVLSIVGILWLARAAREHEDDRVHATIMELPDGLALLVSRLLPEEQWSELGLHGRSDRARKKRIEALVGERMAARREVETALRQAVLQELRIPGEFGSQLMNLLEHRDDKPEDTAQ